MNTIILGVISLICFVILSLISKRKIIWKITFCILFFISAYNIYQNLILEKKVIEVENRIETSSIQVNIDITVNKDTQRDMDGRIASVVHACELTTKSDKKLIYKSEPGSTRIIRGKRKYSYSYRAKLQAEDNIFRNSPEEFVNAKQLAIPLSPFVKSIKKDIGNATECILAKLETKYFANNTLVYTNKYEPNIEIDTTNNNTAYINLQNNY